MQLSMFRVCEEDKLASRPGVVESEFLEVSYLKPSTWKNFPAVVAIPDMAVVSGCLFVVLYQRDVVAAVFMCLFFVNHSPIMPYELSERI